MLRVIPLKFAAVLFVFLTAGCAGTKTFNQTAYSGDTVAIPVGWQENWSRDAISVWVRPNGGAWTQYPANDSRIRAVVNLYPDPLASITVSNRTGQNLTPSAITYGNNVTNLFASGSRDWFQTVVFFDLPDPMALGPAEVYVEEVANTNNAVSMDVEIIGTGGTAHDFDAELVGPLQRQHLAALERVSHYTVTLSGTGAIPHAVQLEFAHDPDVDNGGTGKAYAVEPISGLKNISWSDDGTLMRVIIIPADGNALSSFDDFRFYISGGIANLSLSSTEAYDINGAIVTGVSATIVPHNIVITSSN